MADLEFVLIVCKTLCRRVFGAEQRGAYHAFIHILGFGGRVRGQQFQSRVSEGMRCIQHSTTSLGVRATDLNFALLTNPTSLISCQPIISELVQYFSSYRSHQSQRLDLQFLKEKGGKDKHGSFLSGTFPVT